MKGRLLHRAELSPRDEDAMYALLARGFQGVTREHFRRDLDGKNWVILLEDGAAGPLLGFSTLHWQRRVHAGRPLAVIYSGDTIVDPAADAGALSRTWIGTVNVLRREHPEEPVYWLLICSGFRTYRFLPLYWREFHPRFDAPTPPHAQELMDILARERFGALYDGERGIVRLSQPQVLQPALAGIPEHRRDDPHVAFFSRRNPGHVRGDELVCLAELSRDNLTPAGERMWRAGEAAFTSVGPSDVATPSLAPTPPGSPVPPALPVLPREATA